MKQKAMLLFAIVIAVQSISAQQVWKSANGTVTFTKAAFADWKLPANQDRLSDSVWITRANTQSLFNIRKDTAYAANAPSGTMWAIGPIDSFATLTYKTFVSLSGGSPQGLIGKDLVLKLMAENIYLDIKFLTYVGGNSGGAFSYTRAAKPGATSVNLESAAPTTFTLEQNYPNPFNPTTAIRYQLSAVGQTSLIVYDAIGREAATLVNEVKEAGSYTVQFDATQLASGVYFARLQSGGKVQVRKLMLMK